MTFAKNGMTPNWFKRPKPENVFCHGLSIVQAGPWEAYGEPYTQRHHR